MNKTNYLTRWKIQLDSNNRDIYVVALFEMLEMLEQITEKDTDSFYLLLIDSDICHFLSGIMRYNDQYSMNLLNKIISHLSEKDEFFKNDFVRILKGYIRVINSFPPAAFVTKELEMYHQSIFSCVFNLIKRARDRNYCDDRIPFSSIIATFSYLNEIPLNNVAALGLINLIIELIILKPSEDKNDDKNCHHLGEILRKLSTETKNLLSEKAFMLLSKILQNVLNMIPEVSHIEELTSEHKILRSVIVDKFLAIIDFTLKTNENPRIYEIFCNMFYRLLTSDKLKLSQKLQLLHWLFNCDGHNFMMRVIKYDDGKETPVNHFKSTLVMAAIVNTFLKLLKKSTDSEKDLEKKSHDIVFTADKKLMNPMKNDASYETMMMYTFMKFVDFIWKNPMFNKTEVFCNVSLILAVTNVKKMLIDPNFLHMLTVLFISTFQPVTIKRNSLIQVASEVIIGQTHTRKLDLNYLRWWKIMKKPKAAELEKVVIEFLKQKENLKLDNLQPEDLKIFNQKLMMKAFLGSSTLSIEAHNNLKKILCSFTTLESLKEYQKLLEKFSSLQSEASEKTKHQQQRLINVMDVMNARAENVNDANLKRETVSALMKTLKTPSTSQHVKISAIQMATNLMMYKD